jgi:hypothetical protein
MMDQPSQQNIVQDTTKQKKGVGKTTESPTCSEEVLSGSPLRRLVHSGISITRILLQNKHILVPHTLLKETICLIAHRPLLPMILRYTLSLLFFLHKRPTSTTSQTSPEPTNLHFHRTRMPHTLLQKPTGLSADWILSPLNTPITPLRIVVTSQSLPLTGIMTTLSFFRIPKEDLLSTIDKPTPSF